MLNHPEIDEQHKFILHGLDNIRRDMVGGLSSVENIKAALKIVYDAWEKHKAYEIYIMTTMEFGGQQMHEDSHKLVTVLFDRVINSPNGYVLGDLIEDLLQHIDTFDMAFLLYMKEKGKSWAVSYL